MVLRSSTYCSYVLERSRTSSTNKRSVSGAVPKSDRRDDGGGWRLEKKPPIGFFVFLLDFFCRPHRERLRPSSFISTPSVFCFPFLFTLLRTLTLTFFLLLHLLTYAKEKEAENILTVFIDSAWCHTQHKQQTANNKAISFLPFSSNNFLFLVGYKSAAQVHFRYILGFNTQ